MAIPSARSLLPAWLTRASQSGASHSPEVIDSVELPPYAVMPWDDGFTPSGCDNAPGRIVRDQPRSTVGAFAIVDSAVSPATADALYKSAVRAKVWGVYVRMDELESEQSHTTDAELSPETLERKALAKQAIQQFLRAQTGSIISSDDWQRAHGVAVWVIASDCEDETEYHLDYAEMVRYETNVIFPPIYGATLHVSPLVNSESNEPQETCSGAAIERFDGGGFHVNTRGLAHYQQYGYKTRLAGKLSTDALEAISAKEPGWEHVPYRYRRGIVCDGEFPHFSGRVRSLPAGLKRVVVGFNLFPPEIGPFVDKFPEHSDAFNKYVKLSQAAAKQLRLSQSPQAWSLESLRANPKQAAFVKWLARKVREKQRQEQTPV